VNSTGLATIGNVSSITRVTDRVEIWQTEGLRTDCPATLLMLAEAAADYLARAVSANGKFRYSHDPRTGRTAKRYNILRHAGAILALLEASRAVGNQSYLEAAARALAFLDRKTERLDGGTCRVVERGKAKIGGNALAALCYAKPETGRVVRTGEDRLRSLLGWIAEALNADGTFVFHKWDTAGERACSFVSEYYPGEACLALVRGFEATGEERWLDAARRIAETRIDQQRSIASPPHDHWLLYALDALDAVMPSARYVQHAAFLADAMLEAQHGDEAPPGWEGGYDVPPRSTPTSTRMEGLIAAARLARRHGAVDLERAALAGITSGLRFVARCQLGSARLKPGRASGTFDPRGGVVRGCGDDEIRIDYVQHAISAYLGYRTLILTGEDSVSGARPIGTSIGDIALVT
jgi:hypothetical protein